MLGGVVMARAEQNGESRKGDVGSTASNIRGQKQSAERRAPSSASTEMLCLELERDVGQGPSDGHDRHDGRHRGALP